MRGALRGPQGHLRPGLPPRAWAPLRRRQGDPPGGAGAGPAVRGGPGGHRGGTGGEGGPRAGAAQGPDRGGGGLLPPLPEQHRTDAVRQLPRRGHPDRQRRGGGRLPEVRAPAEALRNPLVGERGERNAIPEKLRHEPQAGRLPGLAGEPARSGMVNILGYTPAAIRSAMPGCARRKGSGGRHHRDAAGGRPSGHRRARPVQDRRPGVLARGRPPSLRHGEGQGLRPARVRPSPRGCLQERPRRRPVRRRDARRQIHMAPAASSPTPDVGRRRHHRQPPFPEPVDQPGLQWSDLAEDQREALRPL